MKKLSIQEFQEMPYIKHIFDEMPKLITDDDIRSLARRRDKTSEVFGCLGFSYQDMSGSDLSKLTPEIARVMVFSSSTIFPKKDKMPAWFCPDKIIENALNRKIGMITLPKNDKKLAIIDNPTQFDEHNAFKNASIEFVDFSGKNDNTHFHMGGVLGNICADKVGAVKNLDIIAYSCAWADRHGSVIKALEDVLSRLDKGEKICAVSISSPLIYSWMNPLQAIVDKINLLVDKLKRHPKCCCEVVDSYRFAEDCNLWVAYCKLGDVNDTENYHYRPYPEEHNKAAFMTSKVIPEFASSDGWMTSCDGVSWAIPISAALYCGCRIYDDKLTFNDFAMLCNDACIKNKNGARLVMLDKVLEKVQNNKENHKN